MTLPNGALAYVSATRGFKSGGFNLSSTAPGRGYAPEWAWSYEGGWKGTLMGGRSRFSTSAFVMDYTNLQVQTPIGIGVLDIRNAAAATIRGIEVEGTSLRPRHPGRGPSGLARCHLRPVHRGRRRRLHRRRSGNRLNNAPEWAGRLWIEWTGDIGRSPGCPSPPSRQHSRRCSTHRSTTASSGRVRMACLAPESNTALAIADGRSALRPGISRARTTSREPSARRPTAYAGRPGPSRQFAVDFTVRR